MDIDKLKETLGECTKQWDATGIFAYNISETTALMAAYGYADRGAGRPLALKDTFLLPLRSKLFTAVSILQLAEGGKLKLTDKIDKYLPECIHSDKITIDNLLMRESGLPDYFYEKLIIDLNSDETYAELPREEKVKREAKLEGGKISLGEVIEMVNGMEMKFAPGQRHNSSSTTELVFLKGIIEAVSGMSFFDYLKTNFFEPLKITGATPGIRATTLPVLCPADDKLVLTDNEGADYECVSVTIDDVLLIAKALQSRDDRLLSRRMWDKTLVFKHNKKGYLGSIENGTPTAPMSLSGYSLNICYEPEGDFSYVILSNEKPIYKVINNRWSCYTTSLIDFINSQNTYPKNTRLVPVNENNVWDAMDLQVSDEQMYFVDDARSSIAMCMSNPRELKPLVLMEGERSVGLAVLKVNAKKGIYYIEIIQIDKNYQSRGYGKILMREVVKYLKEKGAVKLEIDVARDNEVAHRLYLSTGFKDSAIYGGVIHMTSVL
ncbi:MAG: GNAT family N-acetyltransferase [Eubacteriaceae bacterium]|nr:GNAT family N-acetyltransferase [Eubacteriaceae bacterium]